MIVEADSTSEVWRQITESLTQDPERGLNTFQESCGRWASDRSKLALVVRHPDGASERWTYYELAREAARASRMFAEAGLRPGDRVAAVLTRQIEAWVCALAAWRSGLVYVPLFVGFGGDALAARLGTSACGGTGGLTIISVWLGAEASGRLVVPAASKADVAE